MDVSKCTIAHYNSTAYDFWLGTKDHDVSQNYNALLDAISVHKSPPFDILDFGCGPGRDVIYFKNQGHNSTGLDGSPKFCEMVKSAGGKFLNQDFLSLDLGSNNYDGIFANASLFHVPSHDLPRVLKELYISLRPNGILFSSNPRGDEEGWSGDRYVNYMEFETYSKFLVKAGFTVLRHYFRPTGKREQPWLAVVAKKSK